jgi:hypothetical protein
MLRRQRIILASALVVASTMLVLAAAYAQNQSNQTNNPPTSTGVIFDANGVARCPSGYVYDDDYPAASACRLRVSKSGRNGACQSGYERDDDGDCQLESVKSDKHHKCPDAFPVFDKSTHRCRACYNRPKNPSKRCKDRDFDGDCDRKCK